MPSFLTSPSSQGDFFVDLNGYSVRSKYKNTDLKHAARGNGEWLQELGFQVDVEATVDNFSKASHASGLFNALNRFTFDVSKALNSFFFCV